MLRHVTRDTCTHLVTIVLTGDRRHTKLPTVNHTGAVVTAGRMKPDNSSFIDFFCIVGKQDFASQILIRCGYCEFRVANLSEGHTGGVC